MTTHQCSHSDTCNAGHRCMHAKPHAAKGCDSPAPCGVWPDDPGFKPMVQCMSIKQQPTKMKYIPKGGMCMSCQHVNRDCSWMDFESMSKMKQAEELVIVKCTGFEVRDNNQEA